MTDSIDRRTLEAWDDAHVWHPFTPHAVYRAEEPLLVERGEGHWLIDVDGNRYLDAVSSIWCSAFGHRRRELDDAIRDQLDRIAHATFLGHASVPAIHLAKRLVDLAPDPLTRVFFSDNGSTASEIAVKMAYQYCQQAEGGRWKNRTRFLALGNAYNGDTLGAVSVGGVPLFHATFRNLLFPVHRAPSPYCYRCPLGLERATCGVACLDETLRLIETHADELAGVIVEPGFQGAGGVITYPEGWLRSVREATERHGILLILDEVAAGCGRTGTFFACEREGVVPDFLCLAKMLTGGYLPLAVTLTTEHVFDAFVAPPEEGRTFFHGHTFTGNALGAAAALATLDVFENDRILDTLPATIAHLEQALTRLADHPHVGDIRTCGLAAGIELVADRDTRTPFPTADRFAHRVCRHARDRGVFLRPIGDVLIVMPPLTIDTEEIDLIADALAHGLEQATAEQQARTPAEPTEP
ncbi:MAG: adenosylmethionine--8-amino-7-oxononanoate transaminase [Deltaproteobacteria bacterium]|nr:MAG: adenosylmethionine--8-amino-7-oxononanoate transaminase [Deltaproteobacteria bacterium]